MPTFRVLVHGQGMVVRRWVFLRRTFDLYATRFVEAESVEAAGTRALTELRGESKLALAAILAPTLSIDEIEAVPDRSSTLPQPGIVFYPVSARRSAGELNGQGHR